MRRMVLCNSVE